MSPREHHLGSRILATLLALPLAVSAAITDNLAVYLNFDNTLAGAAGTTFDGIVFTGFPRYTPGVAGQAARFLNDGDSDLISDWALLVGFIDDLYEGDFTVAFWMRTAHNDRVLTGNGSPLGRANETLGWWVGTRGNQPGAAIAGGVENLNVNAAGQRRFKRNLPGLVDGHWHHLALVFDRSENRIRIHLDGLLVDGSHRIGPTGFETIGTGDATVIGTSGSEARPGTGDIDDYAIWTRALDTTEVSRIAGAGRSGYSLDRVDEAEGYFFNTIPHPDAIRVTPQSQVSTTLATQSGEVDPASIHVYLDGIEVTPDVTIDSQHTRVSYQPRESFPTGLSHRARVEITALGSVEPFIQEWDFQITPYTTLPSSFAHPVGSGRDAGFDCLVYQSSASLLSQDRLNSNDRSRSLLNGTHPNSVTGQPYANSTALLPGFTTDGAIHWTGGAREHVAQEEFPSLALIPGLSGGDVVISAAGYLELSAGHHRFGVRSQGQFELRIGAPAADLFNSIVVGSWDEPRQDDHTVFDVYAPVDGLYSVHLMVSVDEGPLFVCEFYSIDVETGKRALVNDRAEPSAIRAFRSIDDRSVPPHVTDVQPLPGSIEGGASDPIRVAIKDGDLSLDPATLHAILNETPITAAVQRQARITTLTFLPSSPLTADTWQQLTLTFGDSTQTVTREWRFKTFPAPREPQVTAHWDFSRNDFSRLAYLDGADGATAAATQFGTTTELGIPPINGETAHVMSYAGSRHERMGFRALTGVTPTSGSDQTDNWTLVMDLLLRGEGGVPLYQLNSNHDGWPEFTIRPDGSAQQLGSGILEQPGTRLRSNQWHRLAVAVDNHDDFVARVYVDGNFHTQFNIVHKDNHSNRRENSMRPSIALFAEGLNTTRPVYVNSIQIRNYTMTEEEIAKLGGAAAAGIPRPLLAPPVLNESGFVVRFTGFHDEIGEQVVIERAFQLPVWTPFQTNILLELGQAIEVNDSQAFVNPRAFYRARQNGHWRFVSVTGNPKVSSLLLFLNRAGSVDVDNVSLVPGSVPGEGVNHVLNGSFESPLGTNWVVPDNYANSSVEPEGPDGIAHLNLTAEGPPSSSSVLSQELFPIVTNATYTLSFWYRATEADLTLTARMKDNSLRLIVDTQE